MRGTRPGRRRVRMLGQVPRGRRCAARSAWFSWPAYGTSRSVVATISGTERPRQQRTAGREQAVEVVGLVERRCPGPGVVLARLVRLRRRRRWWDRRSSRCRRSWGIEHRAELQLLCDRSFARLARCAGARCRRRERRPEQVEIGISEVVERPASRDDHRVGVAAAEHCRSGVGVVTERVEPEDEVLGPHSVRDRGDLRTTGAPAQPLHRLGP